MMMMSADPEQSTYSPVPSSQFTEEPDSESSTGMNSNEKKPTMSRRKAALIAGIACGSLVLCIGITCLVLGVKGYFTFEDPCIGVQSFEVKELDLTSAEGGNAILGLLDTFTNGMASALVPTQATMTLEMILEVNNTNPFDLDYKQGEEGLIAIPADDATLEEDLVVGTWEVPSSTLKKKARNEIPVTLTTTIDLLSTDTMGFAGDFVAGNTMVFRVTGGIDGSAWVPGVRGTSTFVCLANVDNIMHLGSGANIKCRHSTRAAKFIDSSGELEFQMDDFDDEEVDTSCYV